MKTIQALFAIAMLSIGAAFATVNVNTAQQSELQLTQGLDKHKAKAIIEYRAQNGYFTSIDDLEKLPGFSKDVMERVRPQLALTGPAFTAPAAAVAPAPKVRK